MAENWDYISRDQAIDEAIELRQAIEDHVCDHTNCIPRSELPGLPAGWEPGSFKEDGGCVWGMRHGRLCDFALDCGTQYAIFLATLLNTCYPAPTATENGAGK